TTDSSTPSRSDIACGNRGVAGRCGSKSKYISGLFAVYGPPGCFRKLPRACRMSHSDARSFRTDGRSSTREIEVHDAERQPAELHVVEAGLMQDAGERRT